MTGTELISRSLMLKFWDTLSREEIADLREASEGGGTLTPALVARMAPVVGAFGTRWGEGPWTFAMYTHLREFIRSLPPEVTVNTGGDVHSDETSGYDEARLEFGHSNFHFVGESVVAVGSLGGRVVRFAEGR
ncbi:hypothetical protein [Propionicimonas sp.]|uniref:hypothetical protein n=1 Tax=Propionicimonas sp. TaxID=1955623 RepID=UPI001827CB4D|nr:hypothetical protein [Propionicimonas sp.]MBU3977495.1 hypothetical protein [Actinomycetota bacterium]MBA3021420.1 hypothetical protein [Propionicimonas sp.]MBU3986005.1 hypothetical protein [Actinomycetota bacterium]MBU4008790.1 hypothetical protein [Actinomycetota bacterium]MBU4066060.1 hypothetical protein [Actinomycetota bacterium]